MLMEKEFFASCAPAIAGAPNQAARQQLIEAMGHEDASALDQRLFQEFLMAKRDSAATSLFLHEGGRFPLTGVGRINTYAVFAETILNLLKPTGRAGMIVPTGIATDFSTKKWFGHVVESGQLLSLFDFENRQGIFRGVHKSYKFSLLTIGGTRNTRKAADYAFYLQDMEDLADEERHISLSASDFTLFNPNTRTCPIFRSRRDLEIARKMYRHAGVLWRDAAGDFPESNPWGISLQQMFNMASDSHLFRTREELEEHGFALEGNVFVKGEERYMPLYEAKLFHQYDHRFATFDGVSEQDCRKGKARPLTSDEKRKPNEVPLPRYWVHENTVNEKLGLMIKSFKDNNILNIDSISTHPPPPTYIFNMYARILLKQAEEFSSSYLHSRASRYQENNESNGRANTTFSNGTANSGRPFGHSSQPWLVCFRKTTNATNHRTTILSVLIRTAVNDKAPIFALSHVDLLLTDQRISKRDSDLEVYSHRGTASTLQQGGKGSGSANSSERSMKAVAYSLLIANLNSIPLDWAARQAVGGTDLSHFIIKQLPVLPPHEYLRTLPGNSVTYVEMIMPRVLELTYTAYDLQPYARDLGYEGPPFNWDLERRHVLRCELDAIYAHMYNLNRVELGWMLDAPYPSVSFPTLKRQEQQEFGEYRTKRLILEAYDRLVMEP